MGRARTMSVSYTGTELNTLCTANDLGDPRITSLRTDEERVIRELCQLTNLNYRARHEGYLAQVGVRCGTIQQTRLAEGPTTSHEGWRGGFSFFFAIAFLFSPQLARRSATQGFDGRGQSVYRRICPSLYFLIMMSFSKNSHFEFS